MYTLYCSFCPVGYKIAPEIVCMSSGSKGMNPMGYKLGNCYNIRAVKVAIPILVFNLKRLIPGLPHY